MTHPVRMTGNNFMTNNWRGRLRVSVRTTSKKCAELQDFCALSCTRILFRKYRRVGVTTITVAHVRINRLLTHLMVGHLITITRQLWRYFRPIWLTWTTICLAWHTRRGAVVALLANNSN